MDAAAVTNKVRDLNAANHAGKPDDVLVILNTLKSQVVPTEDLLRSSKAGVAVGKLRQHPTPAVSSLAKEIVKKWRDAVEEKKKRKRAEGDDGKDVKKEKEDGGAKRVKAEAGSSAASHSRSTPASTSTPDIKQTSPPARQPLSTIDSSRTTPRTAKSDGIAASLKADASYDGGRADDVRDKCVILIYDALALDSNAESKILQERARGIERAAHKAMNNSTGNDYRAKMRSLYLNLKDKGNPALRNEIVLGDVTPETVASMTKDEMASESVRMLNQKLATDNLFKAKAVGETQAETDAFKCGRCQQRKCTYYQMQTRSADEPMTVSVFFTQKVMADR
ncbi:transcription elongation factor S-II [Cryptococcus wingfieldii CBS 7118]|uniref:Transcription elongation factor S-II n=1 Tax=Cryptococcus wingfieldii CBS 7118 TaxID=1295528 RepID=A0A1E3JBN1_9TREE|nr:transcription elongation factor S-II [Cryptococcus wingfieldii CBS 7118]ODN97321.1 transcription elongation factor S-II [Cryptococcus wingfieldii CBS 7118]